MITVATAKMAKFTLMITVATTRMAKFPLKNNKFATVGMAKYIYFFFWGGALTQYKLFSSWVSEH